MQVVSFPLHRTHWPAVGQVALKDLVAPGGKLTTEGDNPTPASRLRYEVTLKGATKHIEKLSDFSGLLSIDSAEKAISLARQGDYSCDYPTATPGETLQEIWHSSPYGGMKGFPEGDGGWVSDRTWKRLALKEPVVTRRKGYWSISRPVVIEVNSRSVSQFQPYVIHENISDGGGYRLVSKGLIDGKAARKVAWRLEWGE